MKLPELPAHLEEPVISGNSRSHNTEEVSVSIKPSCPLVCWSLDSFCIYCDLCLWMGTSEAIKVIWRQNVSN